MKVHDCRQGSSEWFALRLGIPTVSRFGRIMTPARLGYSKAAPAFAAELVAEELLGYPLDFGADYDDEQISGRDASGNVWTRRGTDLEAEARLWYAALRDVDVQEVGFVTTDDEAVGGSPDGLVDADGGLEIKCRGAKAHVRCLVGVDPIADTNQIQGYLWLTGRAWWDVLAYNPSLPKRIERHYPDPAWAEAWTGCLERFGKDMERAEAVLLGDAEVIEDDNLAALLAASLKAGVDADPDALGMDDVDLLRVEIREARAAGVLDAADEAAIMDDVVNGRWASVRSMRKYLARAREAAR